MKEKSELEKSFEQFLGQTIKEKDIETYKEFFRTVLGCISFNARQEFREFLITEEKYIELQNSIINIADYLKINNPLYLNED